MSPIHHPHCGYMLIPRQKCDCRAATVPRTRTAAERRADTLFSLRVQVEQALRKAEGDRDKPYRAGLLEVMTILDKLHHRSALKVVARRNRPEKLYPIR